MTRSTISGATRRSSSRGQTSPDPSEGGFSRRVLTIVRRIPPGRVATYGDIAALAGRPRAWRAVGNIMRHCTAAGVPCHRVVGSGGRLGGYSDVLVKRQLLNAEGIQITGRRLRHFARVRWHQPGGTRYDEGAGG